jgi:hypothetical protein
MPYPDPDPVDEYAIVLPPRPVPDPRPVPAYALPQPPRPDGPIAMYAVPIGPDDNAVLRYAVPFEP